jgi:hypothetical protein
MTPDPTNYTFGKPNTIKGIDVGGSSSKSKDTRPRGMPRGCRHAFRSGRATDGIGSARQRFALLPIAIDLARCRGWCCASQAKVRYGGRANLAELAPRHIPDRLTRNQDDGAVVLALPAGTG